MCINLNLDMSSSSSHSESGSSSSIGSDEEMDFSSIIDTNMESNQDVTFNRDERNDPIEIFDEDNLIINMVVQKVAGAPKSKSTSQQKASQTPPSQRTSLVTVQKGT